MDYNALAASLINALKQSTNSQLGLLDVNRRNFGEDLMNRANARGTLYSSGNGAQRTRYDATQYLPKYVQTQAQDQQQELGINSQLVQTQQKIDSMNRAADELNKTDSNYYQQLLNYGK